MRYLLQYLPVLFLMHSSLYGQIVQPLPNAHAHNDYEHNRPLFDALAQGFTSIEVDVYLVDDEIYVYHDLPKTVSPNRTLRKLYLEPLEQRIQQNGGQVYAAYEVTFFLMIDIKKNGPAVYQKLKEQLQPYQSMLTTYKGKNKIPGPVTIFLSGDRPIKTLLSESNRLMALDGRPKDIGKGISADYMPVVSTNYNHHFSWNGEGEMPTKEWRKLRSLTANVHSEGKRIRFWGTPDKPAVWDKLLDAQVDLINTDDLVGLRKFLKP
ncbi:MAG: phosphatidylinositol-specific phospholipase C/glycerophosphodiester phosphodiesterase family protein [Saprospiraceae bacterium]